FLNRINSYKEKTKIQSWKKFLYISLPVCLILSLFLWAKNFISNCHSMLYTVFSMFIVMPYSMLIYTSEIKYLATIGYMSFFWFWLAVLNCQIFTCAHQL